MQVLGLSGTDFKKMPVGRAWQGRHLG